MAPRSQHRLKLVSFILIMTTIAAWAVWESFRTAATSQLTPTAAQIEIFQAKIERGPKAYDQPDEAYAYFAEVRVPAGETTIPIERYYLAQEQLDQLPQLNISTGDVSPPPAGVRSRPSLVTAAPWTELGPGNIGGRTRGLVIDPVTPATMYASGVAGGVWKTTDSGANWTELDDFLKNLAVSSLAMDPNNPSTLYAGTGEGFFNIDALRGNGIFTSTDAGTTWQQLASTDGDSDFYYVMDIGVSPNASNRLYAATRTGLWRSVDSGATWTQDINASSVDGCTDLALRTDAGPNDTVFAACGQFDQATIYRTTNGSDSGASWSAVFSDGANMGRTTLAIAPSNQAIIYALSASNAAGNYLYGLHAVFRSTSNGDSGSWSARVRNTDLTKVNTLQLTNPIIASYFDCYGVGSNSFYNQGWYDNVIAVDPSDPDKVWTGGIDLFRSDDGGQNWLPASLWWNDTGSWYVHADQHVIAFHPDFNGTTNQTMYVGNDGGIFQTDNATTGNRFSTVCYTPTGNHVTWTDLNNSYAVTQFYHGVGYPGGTTYFGGTQDNGTLRSTDGAGANGWVEINGGDGGYVAVDPGDTSILFAENTRLSIEKSTNGGGSFSAATSGITESSGNFLFINPFLMDPNNADILWTGGRAIWRTSNQAASWVRASISSQLSSGSFSAWAVQPGNSDLVLAGTSSGLIYRNTSATTATSSTNWPDQTTPAAFGGHISWIAFDPNNTSTVFATVSNFGATHLWRSTDAGVNWSAYGGSLPDVPFHTVLVDPEDSTGDTVYVGTDMGMIMTIDGGTTWYYAQGFPRVITEAFDVQPVGGIASLFAFTHGRGVLRAPLSIPTSLGLLRFEAASPTRSQAGVLVLFSAVLLIGGAAFWLSRRRAREKFDL